MSDQTSHENRIQQMERSTYIPDRAVIVPTLDDALTLGEYFGSFCVLEHGKSPDTEICAGSYGGVPIAVMVCGEDSYITTRSMYDAEPLGFRKAIYLGTAKAISAMVKVGGFVLPASACRWEGEGGGELRFGMKKAKPHKGILKALEKGLGAEKNIVLRTGETYTTGACPPSWQTPKELRKKGYLSMDTNLYQVLRIAKKNETKAAALLFVDRPFRKISGIEYDIPEISDFETGRIYEKNSDCLDKAYQVVLNTLKEG